jgi:hypothetical protein
LTGSTTILALINLAATVNNYAAIKNFACPCLPGFRWESVRLRCFN